MFMSQISIYESNELTAFGFFEFNLKLFVSVSSIIYLIDCIIIVSFDIIVEVN